jgi:hypothetical protein
VTGRFADGTNRLKAHGTAGRQLVFRCWIAPIAGLPDCGCWLLDSVRGSRTPSMMIKLACSLGFTNVPVVNLPKTRCYGDCHTIVADVTVQRYLEQNLAHQSYTSLRRFPVSTLRGLRRTSSNFISANFQYFLILKLAVPPHLKPGGTASFRIKKF